MKKGIYITCLLLGLCYSTISAQWLKGKEKYYVKIGSGYLQADEHFTSDGARDPNATRTLLINSVYAKYGISKKLNVVAYIPFLVRVAQNDQVSSVSGKTLMEGEAVNAFGDMNLSVEYALLKWKKWALSSVFTLGVPSGQNSGGSDGSYQTGDGEWNQQLRLNVGTSYNIGKSRAYAKTFFAFNQRNNGFSDELNFGAETGIPFLNRNLFIITRAILQKSLYNGTLSAQNSNGGIFANNVEFFNVGGEANYKLSEKIGLSLSYIMPLSGRITYASPMYSGGVFFNVD